MKRIVLLSLFAFSLSFINAQKIYFVYLQTESGEPFFIRMNDQLYSSTSSGYLILPRLKDSTYNFKLGFPGKNIDLDFSSSINKKDHGYLIKNFGEKGWGLFDLQSLNVQMASSAKGTAQFNNMQPGEVNAFTDLLSKAADDPSLKQNAILVRQEEKKPQVVEAVVKEEKKPELKEAVVKQEQKIESSTQPALKSQNQPVVLSPVETTPDSVHKTVAVKIEELYKRSQVTKISGAPTADGIESVFVDQYSDGTKDTIRILIPGEKELASAVDVQSHDSTPAQQKFLDISDSTQVLNKREPEDKKEDAKKWWPFGKNKNAVTDDSEKQKKETVKTALFKKNKNETANRPSAENKDQESKKWTLFNKKKNDTESKYCQSVAGNDDFLKLRRKMAGKTNDDGMLEEARKYFKEKCFTTEQIKNLSSMFLSNAGKYNFFDAAHNYVSDKENFSSLRGELKDEYYANRFKNLVGN